jgi:hypothetical protein
VAGRQRRDDAPLAVAEDADARPINVGARGHQCVIEDQMPLPIFTTCQGAIEPVFTQGPPKQVRVTRTW